MTTEELTKHLFEVDERLTRHTEQIKTCFNQISELKALVEGINTLATSVQIIAREQKNMSEKMDGLGRDIEEIKYRPARRWENVVTVIITVIVTAVATYALSTAGFQ